MVWMPPALWTSSTWYLLLGATLQMLGVRRLSWLMRCDVVLHARLAGDGQDVQHGVGAAAHRHVEDHRIVDRLLGDDFPRQQPVAFAPRVELPGHLHDPLGGMAEELLPLGAGGQQRAVDGQGHAQRLAEAVHAVGGEHARAGAAGGAAGLLQLEQLVGAELAVLLGGRADEDVDQVDRLAVGRAAGLHRPAADEHRGNVAAHGAHQHAGHDLVAVGDADHAVEAMGVDHRFHAVGDDFPAGKRILHAGVAHGDAVVDADGVEHERHAARLADALLDELPHLVEVDVAGDDIHVAIADGDERLAEIVVPHAGGAEQAAMGGSGIAQLDDVGTHGGYSFRNGLSRALYFKPLYGQLPEAGKEGGLQSRGPVRFSAKRRRHFARPLTENTDLTPLHQTLQFLLGGERWGMEYGGFASGVFRFFFSSFILHPSSFPLCPL